MRILWHSNAPWIATGYGTQTATWVPRIASLGYEMAISGPFSFAGSSMQWQDFNVYPGAGDAFGSDVIQGHYRHFGADILITLADVFMMRADVMRPMNVAFWTPVDTRHLGAMDARVLREADGTIIAMSKFGKEQLREAGFHPLYVPHGIETDVFKPAEDRDSIREAMHVGPDTFVIGINAANKEGPRKAFSEQLIAFSKFHKRHPDSLLFIHSAVDGGNKLQPLIEALGILPSTMVADQYAYKTGLMPQSQLANWYAAIDILSNTSYAEGFGLTPLEAQACGTPAVLANASTSPELVGPGWLAEGEDYWAAGHDAWWVKPLISEIDRCYEEAWEARENGSMPAIRAKCREFALQYDADKVLQEHWVPVLKHLSESFPQVRRLTAPERKELLPAKVTGGRDLAVLVPSRGRPTSVQRLIDTVTATKTLEGTHLWFAFDDDDETFDECVAICKAAEGKGVNCLFGPRQSLAGWTNELAMSLCDFYPALASFGDDHVPQTPGWDEELLKSLGTCGISYPNDYVREDTCEAVVISSAIVKALGWMALPSLEHFYIDNVWHVLGSRARCLAYLPDVIVEHMHANRVESVPADATYHEASSKFLPDQAAYMVWENAQRDSDVEKVKKACLDAALQHTS